jgi:hypothetical protein
VKLADVAVVPAAFTAFVDVNTTGPAQVVSDGPYTLNVTVPVGVAAPAGGAANVAVSWNEDPSVNVAGATCVVTGSGAFVTTTASAGSLHADDADE